MRLNIGNIHGSDVDLVVAAQQRLRQRIADDPQDVRAHLLLADFTRQRGALAESLERYEEASGLSNLSSNEAAIVARNIAILSGGIPSAGSGGEQPSAFVVLESFLDGSERRELDEMVDDVQENFRAATVVSGPKPDWRMASVIDDDFGDVRDWFNTKILDAVASVRGRLDTEPFEIDDVELQLSAHHDGDFYQVHRDASPENDTRSRAVTFVYYFFSTPKPFTGGDLLLYDNEGPVKKSSGHTYTRIVPQDNSVVFFGSDIYHQVTPVRTIDHDPVKRRLTLNGWLLRPDLEGVASS